MTDDETTNELKIQKTAQIFFEKQLPVHVSKKNDGWWNGYIQEVCADFIMLNEFKKGLMPIFFIEIVDIESYVNLKKEEKGDERA